VTTSWWIKAGTVTGDATAINKALNANDHLVYDGAAWHLVESGVVAATAFSIHSAADVSDATVGSVATADVKGILVRDNTIADGVAGAYKLVDVIDAGVY